jgi:hypothetical protein
MMKEKSKKNNYSQKGQLGNELRSLVMELKLNNKLQDRR